MHYMKIHIVNTMQHLTSQLTKRVRTGHISSSYTVSPHSIATFILCVPSPISILDLFFCLPQDPMGLTNADNAFTLYYVKYRAAAPKVRVSIMFLLPTEIMH